MKNYHINTHLFTALIMSTLFPVCSCEQQENLSTDSEDQLTINATLDGELDVKTRSYSGDVSLVDKGFTIAGYLLDGQYAPETMTIAPNVFDKSKGYQAVSKLSATSAKFKIPLPLIGLGTEDDPTYLSVLAWTQGDTDTGYGITGQTGNNSVGMPYLDINLQSPEGKQGDIAAAQKIDYRNDYVITAIDLDFKHILSKMTFAVKNSTGTEVSVKSVKLAVAGNALYSKAKYIFNGSDSIGIYSNYNNYYPKKEYTPLGWATTPTLADAQTSTLGELLLIPQKAPDGFYTIKVTYTVNNDIITRTLPLKAKYLQAGKNYIYTLDINADAINVINVSVGEWKEVPTNALPMVPGECGDVVLLLDGYDEPYQHTDGKWYWLDRSGYNNHCQIMDQTEYSGTGSFDITYDSNKKGYIFNRSAFSVVMANHIRIPDLGTVQGNVSCEIVCENLSTGTEWLYPMPLVITQGNKTFNDHAAGGRTIAVSVSESNKNNWDYANTYNPDNSVINYSERLSFSASSGYDWNQRSFYAYSRQNNVQKISLINNTSSAVATATNNTTAYPLKYGIIGATFKGVVNYVRISKKSLSFDNLMDDFSIIAEKFNIKTVPGPYAPKLNGLLACWDARTGLVQGTSNGNGAYWMDQSGNGYFLRADVPQGTSPTASISYNSTRKAIVFAGPKYSGGPQRGVALINPVSMGKTKVLTFELIYQGNGGDLSYSLQFINKKEGSDKVNCRAFTGNGYGFEISHYIGGDNTTNNRVAYLYHQRNQSTATVRQHVVATINYEKRTLTMYVNGVKQTPTNPGGAPIEMTAPANTEMNLGYTILGNQQNLGQAFSGDIHAFCIYNRELTQPEISGNYSTYKSAFDF